MPAKAVFVKTSTIAGAIAVSLAVASPQSWARGAGMSAVDTNHDGSISMQEAHDAAAKRFDRLDKEHTGKLTTKQLGPMARAINEMTHHDKAQAIDKEEYMSGVDAAFKEADPTGSGMLNAKALKTKAGRRFLKLVE